MNKLFSRPVALLLALLMTFAVIPAGAVVAGAKERPSADVKAIDTAVYSDMLARAEAMLNYQWSSSNTIYTWNNSYCNGLNYFPANQTVTGMPYTLFSWELGFLSLLSLNQFKPKASTNYSTTHYCDSVSANRTGPAYGSCCADFVSEVFGGNFMLSDGGTRYHSVYGVQHSDYCTTYYSQPMSAIRTGDAISNTSGGHIMWVGEVTSTTITIYEQTPPKVRKVVLSKASNTDSSGYFRYNGSQYSTVSRINVIDRDINYVDINPGDYYFYNLSTGMYMQADAAELQANVGVAAFADSPLQQFKASKSGDYYVVTLGDGDLRLNPSYSGTFVSGSNMNIKSSSSEYENDQHWRFELTQDGNAYILHNARVNNFVLSVSGTNVIVESYTGSGGQLWQLLPYYAVTYNANGGSGAPAAQTKVYGVDLALSSRRPTRSNYGFLGWAESADATAATYQPGDTYTGNAALELYAVWQELSDPDPDPGIKYGDVDGNGIIEALDYLMAKRAVIGTYVLNEEQFTRADIDGNGSVDATDYLKIKRHVLGTYVITGPEGGSGGSGPGKFGGYDTPPDREREDDDP